MQNNQHKLLATHALPSLLNTYEAQEAASKQAATPAENTVPVEVTLSDRLKNLSDCCGAPDLF